MTRLWADMDVCDTIYNECRRGTEPALARPESLSSFAGLFAVTLRSCLRRLAARVTAPAALAAFGRTTRRRHDDNDEILEISSTDSGRWQHRASRGGRSEGGRSQAADRAGLLVIGPPSRLLAGRRPAGCQLTEPLIFQCGKLERPRRKIRSRLLVSKRRCRRLVVSSCAGRRPAAAAAGAVDMNAA